MASCDYWKCGRPAVAKGLCSGHYKQLQRGDGLTDLRTEAGVKLPGLTVSQDCAAALEAQGPTAYEAARLVLERWAKRHAASGRSQSGSRIGTAG